MTIEILIFGFLFGAILGYANLNKYNVISGFAILKDLTVAKSLLLAIGIGAILLNIAIQFGLASYHIKPFIWGGLVFGGLIFGSGMAILGYCPGTMAISAGQGSVDAMIGIVGGLIGGFFYTLLYPMLKPLLGANAGALALNNVIHSHFLVEILVAIFGAILVASAFLIDKKEHNKDKKWIFSGLALGVLDVIVFLKIATNRPIGASTSYPYIADVLSNNVANDYFSKIKTPGHWEMIFLLGALLAGFIISLIKKQFKLKLIHSRWQTYKGNSKMKRIVWSFVGGFILIFGARMAGGCTSGHILSGGMQIAFSSLFFSVFVFIGLIITGKLFYSRKGIK